MKRLPLGSIPSYRANPLTPTACAVRIPPWADPVDRGVGPFHVPREP